MRRKVVSGTVLMLLLTSMLALAFNIKPAKGEWTGTVYIRADGSIDPPDAPITTNDNITYTLTGNIRSYRDGMVVERDNIVIDGVGYTLQGDRNARGMYLYGRSNVTIKNINVKEFVTGISLSYSNGIRIYGNNITENIDNGIHLWESSNNSIFMNEIKSNRFGVALRYLSYYNNIFGNTFINNGLFVWFSYRNVVKDNTVNGKPLIYLEGLSNYKISDAGQVILVGCSNITVTNVNLSRTTVGVELWDTRNSVISGNTLKENNWCGIYLGFSKCNNISLNSIEDNYFGIFLYGSSRYNSISENSIMRNNYGIILGYESSNNKIFHNNFIDNTYQAYSEGAPNTLDDGYPSGGNYWSDYTGVDNYSGPYQNETGSDRIGDTPYVIDENNVDHYPLMNPYTITPPAPLVINATVDINPKALNLRSRGKWVTAYIELPEGYDVDDINVSTIMLNDTVPAELRPVAIGDYDEDEIPDLMVKFDRAELTLYVLANVDRIKLFEERFMTITLTLTGKLNDGTLFQGSYTIRIIMPMPRSWRFMKTLEIFPI